MTQDISTLERNHCPDSNNIPLSLYIHIPWCVRKCPYCDFNSHQVSGDIPVEDYVRALQKDLDADRWMASGRKIHSIFFGGGTPSLLPNQAIGRILETVETLVGIEQDAEITLEANPGTVEYHDFSELRQTGVNRLSVGVQSFNPQHLTRLGRIHSPENAQDAIQRAGKAGFDNINIDLMHGLPEQTVEQALSDLHCAQALTPTHISWYQLTIEQNTEFFSRPPALPAEDTLVDIMEAGQNYLKEQGYHQYEVSAYAQEGRASQHNLNYWTFGDYMAIGAGGHGKITDTKNQQIFRYRKTRLPRDYLDTEKEFTAQLSAIPNDNLTAEFMMNALRLNAGTSLKIYSERTGMDISEPTQVLNMLHNKGLIKFDQSNISATALGRKFLNNVLEAFL